MTIFQKAKIFLITIFVLFPNSSAFAHGGSDEEYTNDVISETAVTDKFSLTDFFVIATPIILILGFFLYTFLSKKKLD